MVFRLCDGVVTIDAADWLLLGCALSRYLWDIDVTMTSVVLSATSFGVIFYLSIVIAGTLPRAARILPLPPILSAVFSVTSYPHFVHILLSFLVLFLPGFPAF